MVKANLEICNSFNKHAKHYQKVAAVQLEIGTRLFKRLDYFKFEPLRILDLGCGPGFFSDLLQKKYINAEIFSLDIASQMLKQAESNYKNHKIQLINADAGQLPFSENCFDLVFANQVIHWIEPLQKVFSEILRVLKVNGILLFSTLGPHSSHELKTAWSSVDLYAHTHDFLDMHHIGDILLKESYLYSVIDMEYIKVQYPSAMSLLKNIKSQGVKNINPKENRALTTPSMLKKFINALPKTEEDKYPVTYEVIYGHAIKAEMQTNQESFVTIDHLRNSLLSYNR